MATASSSRRSSWMNNYEAVELEVPDADLVRSSKVFTPSPLNPSTSPPPSSSSTVTRSATTSSHSPPKSDSPSPPPRFVRASSSMTNIGPRMPSEESRILGSPGSRGSMILYHLPIDGPLSPPPNMNRLTMMSTHSRDSTISYSSDSKYPGQLNEHDVQPYLFDPELDGGTFDKEDLEALSAERSRMSWRGVINVVALVSILAGIIGLFVIYPATGLDKSGRQARIVGNRYINGTGQATGF